MTARTDAAEQATLLTTVTLDMYLHVVNGIPALLLTLQELFTHEDNSNHRCMFHLNCTDSN